MTPASGPDTPTWTTDDDDDATLDDLVCHVGGGEARLCIADLRVHTGKTWVEVNRVRDPAFDALVAAVRAARAHERCGPATDTLRRARKLALVVSRLPFGHYERWLNDGNSKSAEFLSDWEHAHAALIDLLVDGGGDG